MKYIIIGNGIAGIQAAETIRQMDPAGDITMIGDETFPPYSRPMISMVLEGSVTPQALQIRSEDFYSNLRIEPVLGTRITGIDIDSKAVIIDETESGGRKVTYPFDKLLIATGADPRPIKAQGLGLDNIFYMRHEGHVRGMLEALKTSRTALVLGGGLVGFKAAYGLMKRGLKVTMLIKSGYPLSMQIDEEGGKLVLGELLSYGLDVRVGIEAAAFEGNGKVASAHLSDGSQLPCDMVVIGKGVLPALSFVPREKLRIDLGIVVDKHLETTVPGIFAAGDVAEYVDIARKIPWVNAIWPEAVNMGQLAGTNMAGRPAACKGTLSRNVIRIFNVDVMSCGLVNPSEDTTFEIISDMNSRTARFRKLIFKDDVLVGMVMVNDIDQGGIFVSLIQSEMPIRIPKRKLLEPGFNFKQLM